MHNRKTREKFNTILVSSNYTLHNFQNIVENAYFLNNKWLHSLQLLPPHLLMWAVWCLHGAMRSDEFSPLALAQRGALQFSHTADICFLASFTTPAWVWCDPIL